MGTIKDTHGILADLPQGSHPRPSKRKQSSSVGEDGSGESVGTVSPPSKKKKDKKKKKKKEKEKHHNS